MIEFRKATINDSHFISRIGSDSFLKTYIIDGELSERNELIRDYVGDYYSEDNIKKQFQLNDIEYYLIIENDQIVGYAKILNEESPFPINVKVSKFTFQIEKFYLTFDKIGNGLGKLFLNYIMNILIAKSAKEIWLSVYEENIRAIKFYEKNGFKKVGRSEFSYTSTSGKTIVDYDFIYSISMV